MAVLWLFQRNVWEAILSVKLGLQGLGEWKPELDEIVNFHLSLDLFRFLLLYPSNLILLVVATIKTHLGMIFMTL